MLRRVATHVAPLLAALTVGAAATASAQGLSNYNVLSFGSFFMTNTDVTGTLAVGGAFSASNFGVGAGLPGAAANGALVVGGAASLTSGQVYNGPTYIAGARAITNATVAQLQAQNAPLPVDFAAEQARLTALSTQIGAMAPTATALSQWSQMFFLGASSGVNVFTVSATELNNAPGGYNFYAPTGGSIIVNVTGFDGTTPFRNTGFNFCTGYTDPWAFTGCSQVGGNDNPGGLASMLLWNFVSATPASMTFGGSVAGSVLAPNVALATTGGACNGTYVVGSATIAANSSNTCEFHQNAYNGWLPSPPVSTVPEPATFVLAAGGLMALALVARRRTRQG